MTSTPPLRVSPVFVALTASLAALLFAGCSTPVPSSIVDVPPKPAVSPVTAATPSENSGGQVFELGQLDQPPRATVQGPPRYPAALRKKNVSGEAVVEFIVNAQGGIAWTNVVSATHPDFGDAAAEAIRKWKFSPAIRAGKPVAVRMRVPIAFSLNEGD
jgi:TonB family protein